MFVWFAETFQQCVSRRLPAATLSQEHCNDWQCKRYYVWQGVTNNVKPWRLLLPHRMQSNSMCATSAGYRPSR